MTYCDRTDKRFVVRLILTVTNATSNLSVNILVWAILQPFIKCTYLSNGSKTENQGHNYTLNRYHIALIKKEKKVSTKRYLKTYKAYG